MNHGIPTAHLEQIKNILKNNCKSIEKVGLFGSRATGCFTKNSDIDLVLYGNVSEQETARLLTCFHESLLPHKVDIASYQHITFPALKQHIDDFGQELFSKETLYGKKEENALAALRQSAGAEPMAH